MGYTNFNVCARNKNRLRNPFEMNVCVWCGASAENKEAIVRRDKKM